MICVCFVSIAGVLFQGTHPGSTDSAPRHVYSAQTHQQLIQCHRLKERQRLSQREFGQNND